MFIFHHQLSVIGFFYKEKFFILLELIERTIKSCSCFVCSVFVAAAVGWCERSHAGHTAPQGEPGGVGVCTPGRTISVLWPSFS